jgi:hypothetical protein
MKRNYFLKIGDVLIMLRVRTEAGAIKKAQGKGEGVQVWYDNPDESWAAKLLHVT